MNQSKFTQKIYSSLLSSYQWYLGTPERSLDEAYKAALLIKAMEDEHFDGKKIAPESANYGDSVMAYFQSELNKQLKTARMRLSEFKLSRSVFNNSSQTITKLAKNDGTTNDKDSFAIQLRTNPSLILEKLRFIDEVTSKYTAQQTGVILSEVTPGDRTINPDSPQDLTGGKPANKPVYGVNQTSIVPRSILGTINRLKVELDPKSEEEVVNKFRTSQRRTLISVRLILMLIIVPFLAQQLSKNLVISPIVDRVKSSNEGAIFLNYEMEEKAFVEMQRFEEKLKFENLLLGKSALSNEEMEEQMKEKVHEIARDFSAESANAIKNVFADIIAVGAFIWLLVASKREIAVLKDFMDNIIYGLSDSAKAFIIILLTDVFVGFHSPHGWEVILETVSRHFGLPENREFIFLFIATFPVILDTIFKYWIFRYLNRVSPSAVATYRNMNE